ncbi:chitin disaccharide deacetylase [Caenibacillus caldisaponilyticus]|uniref:chitin disaccharide deacetylase n=1 Tax=Caenibacillus caldisaponilyticus TaxID=1674942 RepID=UPI0009883564|nr:chitin disaccharide deacetylase [Caenibacillus caldisaponilyticus]
MRLIVNADDFAYTPAVTYGILDAFLNGIVTSTTMMCNSPHFAHAVKIAKQYPKLGVGVHLVLTWGKPLSPGVSSLVDESGYFYKQQEIFDHARPEDIEREWTAQIERFISEGLEPTHLDSHHNVHGHELALPVAIKLAKKYGIPLRRAHNGPSVDEAYGSVLRTDLHLRDFYGDGVSYDTLEKLLEQVAEREQYVEINCHPAFIDNELKRQSSYVETRLKEHEIVTSERIKDFVKKKGIKLITYRDLAERLRR